VADESPERPTSSQSARRTVRRRLRHDLSSPLSVIIGRCDMLLQGAHGPLNADQRRALESVLRSAERLEREVRALAVDYDLEHPRGAGDSAT